MLPKLALLPHRCKLDLQISTRPFHGTERQYDNEFGDLLFVCGQADSGRLLTIRCQRVAPEVSIYGIVAVRLANKAETEQWKRRFA